MWMERGVSRGEGITVQNVQVRGNLMCLPHFRLQDRDRFSNRDSLGRCIFPACIDHVPNSVGELGVVRSGWT